ncbi:MAG TPA: hypothetical protein VFE96_00950 [Candidatus Bathyarchaeia archaeon]|nr:hypothetical protein [Candidatus Bathyarchaeia archaeon]
MKEAIYSQVHRDSLRIRTGQLDTPRGTLRAIDSAAARRFTSLLALDVKLAENWPNSYHEGHPGDPSSRWK